MNHIINWDHKAKDELKDFEPHISKRIIKKVKELEKDPFASDIKHLKGQHGFRLRVGDYRVIFEIEGKNLTILKVGHRKHIYDRMN